jgi:hypothetical protein
MYKCTTNQSLLNQNLAFILLHLLVPFQQRITLSSTFSNHIDCLSAESKSNHYPVATSTHTPVLFHHHHQGRKQCNLAETETQLQLHHHGDCMNKFEGLPLQTNVCTTYLELLTSGSSNH